MDERAPEQPPPPSQASTKGPPYYRNVEGTPAPPQRALPSDQTSLDPDEVAALTAFYRENITALVRFLLSKRIRLVDAAEIAQEAMIEAARKWRTIEFPKAWVWRVAARKAVRMVASVEETPTDDVGTASPLLKVSPDEAAHWEEKQEVLRLLRKLPPRQAQVMAWRFDGFKPAEIAEQLQMTPEAVRSNLRKARRSLMALMAEADGDEQ